MASKYAIETVFRLVDEVTKPLNKVFGLGKVTGDRLKTSYAAAETRVNALGKSVTKLIPNLSKVAVATTSAFMAKGVKDAIEFQSALAKVGTVADVTLVPLDKLSKQILDVSSKTGIASNNIAASMYAAIGAGVSTEKAAGFVEVAAKAAIGGFTSEATAIDALSSVINAYGLQAEHATAISDRMLVAQNMGKTSFDEMAQAMGKVVPYASKLGVSIDELFSSVASLTGSGALKTADAMSSMKAVLTSVINPTKEAAGVAKALGVDFSASALQAKGLSKFLQEISEAAGGNQAVLGKLFGSDKADMAVSILTSNGKDAFLGTLDAMKQSAGATEAAFAKMMDTPGKRWAKVMNNLRNSGIQLGNSLLPVIEEGIAKISKLIDSINIDKLSEQFRVAGKIALGLLNVLLKVGPAIGAIVLTTIIYKRTMDALVIVSNIYNGVSMIMNSLQMAYRSVILGNTAATSAMAFQTGAAATVTGVFAAMLKAASKAANSLSKANFVAIGSIVGLTVAQWAFNIAAAANPIGLIIMAIAAAVAALVAIVVLIVKNWNKIIEAVKRAFIWLDAFFSSLGGSIKKVMEPIISSIKGIVSGFVEFFKSVWNGVVSFFVEIWNSISTFFKGIWDGIKATVASAALWFGDVWRSITEAFSAAWSAVASFFSWVWDGIKSKIASFVDWLKPIVDGIVNAFKPIVDGIGGFIKGIKTALSDAAKAGDAAVAAYDEANKKISQKTEKGVEEAEPSFGNKNIVNVVGSPAFDLPGFEGASTDGAMSSAGGKSKIHGVYDISGAAPALGGGSSLGASSNVAGAAQSALDYAVQSILGVIRNIDRNITEIAAWSFGTERALIPAPITAGERTAYSAMPMQERRESVAIEVRAAQGTDAKIVSASPETNIRLIRSGGNTQ